MEDTMYLKDHGIQGHILHVLPEWSRNAFYPIPVYSAKADTMIINVQYMYM